MIKARRTKLKREKLSEAKLAQIAASQLRLMFVNDDQATHQADRSNELLQHQDPTDQRTKRRT
jgi:hypothetical protein